MLTVLASELGRLAHDQRSAQRSQQSIAPVSAQMPTTRRPRTPAYQQQS